MKNKIAVICSLGTLAALIFSSAAVLDSCKAALMLCAELIIPSLFPFVVVSIILNRLGLPGFIARASAPAARLLFGVSGAGSSALIMGLMGGYPLGAAYIADMHESGAIDTDEAEQLLGFCNNSGPAFIIGAVGAGVFSSAKVGIFLYLVHISAAILTGIILKSRRVTSSAAKPAAPSPLPFSLALPEAVKQAVTAIINVCGFVVCFSVFVGLLDAHGVFSVLVGFISARTGFELHWVRALLMGILELGSGVGAMRGLYALPINLALAAFILGWGGLSVHFQTLALLAGSNIKGALHFAGRLISASIACVLAYFIGLIIF
ncbi:MAG: sporulation protein [Oscillospiraceae bacterium]|nr:sporulation protein [Oscillospiraceae bacterium]